MDREIQKIEKAIAKAEKVAASKKAQRNPDVKKGAKKLINELNKRKEELIKLRDEKEAADKEAREAKTEAAKEKAKIRALKADKAFKKFVKAKDPIMMVCKVLTTATGIAAVVALFIFVANNAESGKLLSKLNYYFDNGGSREDFGAMNKINSALRNAGEALRGRGRYSVYTEETNYFPY